MGASSRRRARSLACTSLYGVPIVSLVIDGQERLCLAQISNTLLKNYSYNEIHNRRVALGITCVQCTPVQLEILRRAGAMPISSRRCGMITKREAERLCKSFLGEHKPPKLPENFAFDVVHECAWGSRGSFIPARYNSSRAKCIKCGYCSMYFSPNKFIFHSHRTPDAKYTQPDAANFNSWRRHLKLSDKSATDELSHAWEDVKAMFNGGTRKRTFSLQGGGGGPGPGAGSGGGYISPDFLSEGSSSYHSASPDVDTADEPEVDVESNRFPDDEGAPDEAEPGAPSAGSGPDAGRSTFGDLAADDTVRRPERSPSNGGYELREPCGPLGGPTPAKGPHAGPEPLRKHAWPLFRAFPFIQQVHVAARFPVSRRVTEEDGGAQLRAQAPQKPRVAAAQSGGPVARRGLWGPLKFGQVGAAEPRTVSPSIWKPPPGPRARRESCGRPWRPRALAVAQYLRCRSRVPEPDKEDNHSTAEDLETRKSYPDQRSISQPSPTNTDRGEDGLTLDVTGTQLVEKDIENLARDELQKLLLEQMELRKKLEREFQSLKDNFQDQMKRELAYREEMVQQLQIVRDTLCNELDQERKARYAIQQKLKEAHDALHHFSCKMLTPRHCTGNCSFKPPLLP
ncbi:SKI family transcriptional corepressor 1 [Carlito syrichta]|uniref:SKI family transcriptional corepressor 1 n=1 Tax=Carlito syrichta TaxID=1868482 RepID=A0A1U7U2F5_CARSF|nr:SKI family transcriptional corepressor 1 [Carlito syrichta]